MKTVENNKKNLLLTTIFMKNNKILSKFLFLGLGLGQRFCFEGRAFEREI